MKKIFLMFPLLTLTLISHAADDKVSLRSNDGSVNTLYGDRQECEADARILYDSLGTLDFTDEEKSRLVQRITAKLQSQVIRPDFSTESATQNYAVALLSQINRELESERSEIYREKNRLNKQKKRTDDLCRCGSKTLFVNLVLTALAMRAVEAWTWCDNTNESSGANL